MRRLPVVTGFADMERRHQREDRFSVLLRLHATVGEGSSVAWSRHAEGERLVRLSRAEELRVDGSPVPSGGPREAPEPRPALRRAAPTCRVGSRR
jgi:hypothetical protein